MNEILIKELLSKINENSSIKSIKQLGGLTNHNFLVETIENKYVVRIAGENTSSYINRSYEKYNSLVMTNEEIYLGDLYFDEISGHKITYYKENSLNFAQLDTSKRSQMLHLISKIFGRLHNTKDKFINVFDFFSELDKYLTLCRGNNVKLFDRFEEVYEFVLNTKEDYYKSQKNAVPCHIDPLGENFIFTSEHLYLIDWEYSAMHDKCWDLAGFILENELNSEEEALLIKEYIQIMQDETIQDKILLYKIYQDFLWHLWGLYKFSLQEDFYHYAKERFERSLINLKKYENRYD